jgi:hypothetical protein
MAALVYHPVVILVVEVVGVGRPPLVQTLLATLEATVVLALSSPSQAPLLRSRGEVGDGPMMVSPQVPAALGEGAKGVACQATSSLPQVSPTRVV